MSKHSKGPWEACFSRLDGIPVDFHIAPFEYGTCHPVCEGKIVVGGPFKLTTEEQVANARLIAAAPDLLSALECEEALDRGNSIVAVSILKRNGWTAETAKESAHVFVRRLRRAAILKATGEQL